MPRCNAVRSLGHIPVDGDALVQGFNTVGLQVFGEGLRDSSLISEDHAVQGFSESER